MIAGTFKDKQKQKFGLQTGEKFNQQPYKYIRYSSYLNIQDSNPGNFLVF
jgi:hypothetical protein